MSDAVTLSEPIPALRASPQGRRFERLEALRGFAAFYVFVAHVYHWPGLAEWVLRLGPELVILFFLLSGFVIYYSTFAGRKRPTFWIFFSKRFKRIYPLFLISLVVAYICRRMISDPPVLPIDFWQLGGNLLQLQDCAWLKRGVWFDTFAGNFPYWSLSYEWWFYMMFFALAVTSGIAATSQKHLVGIAAILGVITYNMLPNQISLFVAYFAIWWAGAELCREYLETGRPTFRRQFSMIAYLSVLSGMWLAVLIYRYFTHWPTLGYGYEPALQFRHTFAAVLMIVAALIWKKYHFAGFKFVLGPFALVAPISYALYIFHHPISWLFASGTPVQRLLVMPAVLLVVCMVMELIVQPAFNRGWDFIFSRPAPAKEASV